MRATPTSNEAKRSTKLPEQNAPAETAAQRMRPAPIVPRSFQSAEGGTENHAPKLRTQTAAQRRDFPAVLNRAAPPCLALKHFSRTSPSNGEVEGPGTHAQWRRGRTISLRPRRQPKSISRTPPTIVRGRPRTAASALATAYHRPLRGVRCDRMRKKQLARSVKDMTNRPRCPNHPKSM